MLGCLIIGLAFFGSAAVSLVVFGFLLFAIGFIAVIVFSVVVVDRVVAVVFYFVGVCLFVCLRYVPGLVVVCVVAAGCGIGGWFGPFFVEVAGFFELVAGLVSGV